MSKFAVRKVDSPDTNGFTTTLLYVILHCGNVVGNNNKYYCIELQMHPNGTYRLFTHYGRLNITNIYEIRDTMDGCWITDRQSIEKEFHRIVTKKKKGKKQEGGGIEKYVEVDVSIPTVGSENIRGRDLKETAVTTKPTKAPKFGYSHLESDCQRLIRQLIDENIHAITTSTAGALKLTSRGLETPLGPVTLSHIDKARSVLTQLKDQIDPETRTADRTNSLVIEANNEYYSLIPHDMGRKIRDQDWILDDRKVIDEYELLEQLTAAVQAGTTTDGGSDSSYLDFHMEPLIDTGLNMKITTAIRNSKARNHQGLDVWDWDVKRIFSVEIKKERAAFDQYGSKLQNQVSLFHGSKNQNCLSILFNGLIIPPHNAPWVTARMFGNGVYFASSSTKSLNYSTGFWGGMSNKYKNSFLFVVKVAMGKTYKTKQKMSSGPPAGYDSLHAQAADRVGYDGSLYNDEYIVYKTSQVTIQYMVEMQRTR